MGEEGELAEEAAEAEKVGKPGEWRVTEKFVEERTRHQGYKLQQSFKGGYPSKYYGEKGSVRPDLYKHGRSIEIKRYYGETPRGRKNLIYNIVKQAEFRIKNLPPNTIQEIVIDLRGQAIPRVQLKQLVQDIAQRSRGILDPSNIKIMRAPTVPESLKDLVALWEGYKPQQSFSGAP